MSSFDAVGRKRGSLSSPAVTFWRKLANLVDAVNPKTEGIGELLPTVTRLWSERRLEQERAPDNFCDPQESALPGTEESRKSSGRGIREVRTFGNLGGLV
jgi:hypothetical protein